MTDGPTPAAVLSVPEGSVLVFPASLAGEEEDGAGRILEVLERTVGHRRFAVVFVPDGASVGVLDAAELRALLDERLGPPACPETAS